MRHRVTIIALTGAVAALAFLSPVTLGVVDLIWKPNWSHLADIGQAYGAASAVFSALAVAGVAASLIYQARALRLASVQSIRSSHRELLTRVMDDPQTYLPATGFQKWSEIGIRPEQFIFLTLQFGYFHSALDAGIADENGVREDMLAPIFTAEVGRKWWRSASWAWLESSDPTARRLGKIAESEYERAVAAGPPLSVSAFVREEPNRESTALPAIDRKSAIWGAAALAGTVAVTAAVGWLAKRSRQP
jgi:hypothetical protein